MSCVKCDLSMYTLQIDHTCYLSKMLDSALCIVRIIAVIVIRMCGMFFKNILS